MAMEEERKVGRIADGEAANGGEGAVIEKISDKRGDGKEEGNAAGE